MLNSRFHLVFLYSLFLFNLIFFQSFACTRVLIAENQDTILVGRTMDWHEDIPTQLILYPKNMERIGSDDSSEYTNWMQWTSKYASIVAAAYGDLTTDGLNEAGLSVHILWLEDADYGTPPEDKPLLSLTKWTQFYLDNFESVEEAVAFTQKNTLAIVPFYHEPTGEWGKMHLVLDDAKGDSALFQYLDGKLVVVHDKNAAVVANEPPYQDQVANLRKYIPFGGDLPLPEENNSSDRFVKATYLAQQVPSASPYVELLMNTVEIILDIARPEGEAQKTLWFTISDLTNKIYYFQSMDSTTFTTVSFEDFDTEPTEPKYIDID